MKILDESVEDDEPIKQKNLISLYEGWNKWLVNGVRNSKFIRRYYSGVDNSEWESVKL